MRFFITGEQGFIAQNLYKLISSKPEHHVVLSTDQVEHLPGLHHKVGEPCVYRNTAADWTRFFVANDIEVVIHNAAAVGTDVVALSPDKATLTNILGTQIIADACREARVMLYFMGTSVVYDNARYQETWINEKSVVQPHTYYGVTKAAGDHIVKRAGGSIIRPLFAYGGVGDMNSLIAKVLYASWTQRSEVPIFLDPNKVKDYLHVEDFCQAVLQVCEQEIAEEDVIVAAESPLKICQIVDLISRECHPDYLPSRIVKWHPGTDYLGNHRLRSYHLRQLTDWRPQISLEQGISKAAQDIRRHISLNDGYDPFVYLDEAKRAGVDLTKHF